MAETMNRYISKLTKNQQMIICGAMQVFGNIPDCHRGVLPFLNASEVVTAVRIAMSHTNRPRVYAAILNKLTGVEGDRAVRHAYLTLTDIKVYKRFGKHPERGVFIPGMPEVNRTAGVSFNIGAKDYVPHQVKIPITVALLRQSKNRWWIFASGSIETAVTYLLDHCS